MTDLVTREEADRIEWEANQPGCGEEAERFVDYARDCAHTVVALYECRDRLRDGWEPWGPNGVDVAGLVAIRLMIPRWSP